MIFLGTLFDRKDEATIKENTKSGQVQNQANNFQWNCIDGFIKNGVQVEILNVLPVGTFPGSYKKLYLPTQMWEYNGTRNVQIGCINLPVIKQLDRTVGFIKHLRKSRNRVIVVYSTYLPILLAVKHLNRLNKIVLIVTDLPEFYDNSTNENSARKIIRSIYNKAIYGCLNRVDGFVLLTEAMKYPLNIGDRPYTVVEGICGSISRLSKSITNNSGREKRILYTGTLNIRFGIKTLVEAFESIDNPNYRLQICGGGEYAKQLSELQIKDKRIEYLGFVPREKTLELQQNATVLVNPRTNEGEYTKYSFPSKTMEYLQSGVPTIAYKLEGIPDEYDVFINYVRDNSIEALKNTLIEVCDDTTGKYIKKAERAKVFVEEEKNSQKQTRKIMNLINKL